MQCRVIVEPHYIYFAGKRSSRELRRTQARISQDLSPMTPIPAKYRICMDVAHSDPLAGGHTKAGFITDKRLKISYHGARTVSGGTPSCFNDRSDDYPFGTFTEVKDGGKIIVMGGC